MSYRLETKKGEELSPWFEDMGEVMDLSKRAPVGARVVRDDGVVLAIKTGAPLYTSKKTQTGEDVAEVKQQNRRRGGAKE